MKLSFNSFGYGSFIPWVPAYTLEEAIKRIADNGYKAIEIGAARPHLWPPDFNKEKRQELLNLIKSCNLEVSAICPSSYGFNLASHIDNEREDTIKYYLECVKLAKDFGAKIVVTVPGWIVFPTPFKQAWKWAKEGIMRIAETAEKMEVTLAVEAINSFWANIITRTDHALKMMEEISSDRVKVMLDTQHLFLERENPVDAVLRCGKNLVHVHCADANFHTSERLIPGKGGFGFTKFIHALKQINYQRYLSVELWGPDPDTLAWESRIYLENLL